MTQEDFDFADSNGDGEIDGHEFADAFEAKLLLENLM